MGIARTIYTFDIVGYDAYFDDVLPDLQAILSKEIADENYSFLIAINEAVCNAAKYSVYGYDQARISIELVVTPEDITASIKSKTEPFDALEYRNNLIKLKDNPNYKDMPWSEYTGLSSKSRGFWMMMMAVDYFIIKADGDEIRLNISLPCRKEEISRTIGELVPRFFVEKDGVIS
ncbi:MAG: hypothetical protein IKN12_11285 [Selenomonadaceae bacterium]|nr:hypothetical protein [Selenomonadaceae bacterium]MBR3723325.1 hypothetical protein [Selenomonadaceae bacterium]